LVNFVNFVNWLIFSAVVGVPKSLLLLFEFAYTLYANFLVTNNRTLPDEAL